MNMITGFIEPTEGEILVEGYDISKRPKKAKSQIGYMPEGVPLYSDLTVKEFVKYMAELKKVDRKVRKERVEKIIEQTGLKNVENKLTRNLSRGYKQRVSMAGALVGEPKILILKLILSTAVKLPYFFVMFFTSITRIPPYFCNFYYNIIFFF